MSGYVIVWDIEKQLGVNYQILTFFSYQISPASRGYVKHSDN